MNVKKILSTLMCISFVLIVFTNIGFASYEKEDIVTVACVNFKTTWGDKVSNLSRIKGYLKSAAKQGADIILFPETALTGYDIEKEAKMHKENAETIPGPSTNELAELTKKYGVYAIIGMPERDKNDPNIAYNSAAILGPQGVIGSYRKLQPFQPELKWCTKGSEPFMFDSPWGPIGVGICFDAYMFSELTRYYGAMGARIYLHITALSDFSGWQDYYATVLKARATENMMFVASSNIVGKEKTSNFAGYSLIVGPTEIAHTVTYYGKPASTTEEEIVMATIDLSASDRMRNRYQLFSKNPISGTPDWRLNLYKKLLSDIGEKTDLGKYN